MPAELRTYRRRHLTFLQRIERIFECRIVNARTGIAQVSPLVGRTGVIGVLLGQGGEIPTGCQLSGNLLQLGLGLGIARTIHLDEDMRSATLFGQIADLLAIQLLQLFFRRIDLVEVALLVQLDVFQHDLLRRTKTFGVGFVILASLLIADLHRTAVRRDGDAGEIARLALQLSEALDLLIGNETRPRYPRAQLADEHLLLEQLAELHPRIAHLLDDLVEASRVEHTIDGEFRGLQDQLIQGCLGKREVGIPSPLQQQGSIDQRTEGGITHQLVIEQRGVEIRAQLLHQLSALHVYRLVELIQRNLLAIDLSRVSGITRGIENRLEPRQRQQNDDDADDGFGNPAL